MTVRRGRGPEDELLVLDCQGGSREAFERLAGRWHPRLLYRAMALLGNADEAREVVQESWLSIARGIGSLRDPARFGSWSYRIVQNKATDRIRSNHSHRTRRVEADVDQTPAADSGSTVRDSLPAVRAAIRRLSHDHRRVVELFYLEELTVGEIAALIGIPEGTVKSRLFHARTALRQSMEESR